MKVKTPRPRRKRRRAPKETRAQKGSCVWRRARVSVCQSGGVLRKRAYDRDDLLLDQGGERDELKVESEVELCPID